MIQSNQWQGFDSPPELFALLNIKWRINPIIWERDNAESIIK